MILTMSISRCERKGVAILSLCLTAGKNSAARENANPTAFCAVDAVGEGIDRHSGHRGSHSANPDVQVGGIQSATQESVSAIKEIGDTLARMAGIASVISSDVEEQGAATRDIACNVQQAAHGTQQVSANIFDVQRGPTETGASSEQLLAAAKSLSMRADGSSVRWTGFSTRCGQPDFHRFPHEISNGSLLS